MAEPESEPDAAPAVDTTMNVASLSQVWFLLRAFRITASVVAGAIGLDKYKLPKDLWYKMRAKPLEQSEDNVMCKHGRDEEPNVVRCTEERTGMRVLEAHYRTDTEFPWLGATPDGNIPLDTLSYEQELGILRARSHKRKASMDIREYSKHRKLEATNEQDEEKRVILAGPQRALLECKAPYHQPYSHPPIQYVIQTLVQMRVENAKVNYLSS